MPHHCPGGRLSVAPTRHWVTYSSNPGAGGIFFLSLAPFLLHLFSHEVSH